VLACLIRFTGLAEITEEQGSKRKEASLIDTSQKGDWDNFRNETLNGKSDTTRHDTT
jgi:hypothetical protein